MARADSISTTRRSFLATAAAAVASSPALAEDAELISLSKWLSETKDKCNAAGRHGDDAECQAYYREGSWIFDKITEFQPTTIAGLQAKARSLFWINGDNRSEWDDKLAFDLVDDILAMTNEVAG